MDDEYGEVWLTESEDGPDGYAVLVWGYSIESGGRDALLDEIFVRETGTGAGSRMLGLMIDSVRKQGMSVMFLETERRNEAARRLYRRHGFLEEDSIWMTLDLSRSTSATT